MKVAVVGSRELGHEYYGYICENIPVGCSEIVSGGASGIDRLAERYADENSLKLTVIRPDYNRYDRTAPLIRNDEIIARADYVLVIWNGVSRGSLNVIMSCLKISKPLKVILVNNID